MKAPPARRVRPLLAALVVLALAGCDDGNDSAPSPFVDESGAPLYDEGVEPGEQDDSGGEEP